MRNCGDASQLQIKLEFFPFFQLVSVHQSQGGVTGDGGQSYAATVISAAKVGDRGYIVHILVTFKYFSVVGDLNLLQRSICI